MPSAEHVLDALRDQVAARKRPLSGWGDPTEALDQDVAAFGRRVGRFLAEIPGDLSIEQLRELLDDALHF